MLNSRDATNPYMGASYGNDAYNMYVGLSICIPVPLYPYAYDIEFFYTTYIVLIANIKKSIT